MQQIRLHAPGGPGQLVPTEVPDTLRPGPEQVLVDVEAAGINYMKVYQRRSITFPPIQTEV